MTAVQQMFIEWCIGYMKFEIADAMSVGLMSLEAERYDANAATSACMPPC